MVIPYILSNISSTLSYICQSFQFHLNTFFSFFLIFLIPTIGHQQRQLSTELLTGSDQVLFRFLYSLSAVRLHVSQSLLFLLPIPSRGFHCIACRITDHSSFRRVCPIQPDLFLLMITSNCCISAIFNRFILDIVLGQ